MVIKVEKLSKSFKNIKVLNNVNIELSSGHIYGLSGRNGSGKTVFLKLLCGLFKPTKGHIYIDNKEINIKNNYTFNIGAQIENPNFFPDLTGYQNLKTIAKIRNVIGDNEINNALKIVNLMSEKDKLYGKYSLGMKQKLGIAQAIMEDPQILILDEPFNGIENNSVNEIKNFLVEEKKKDKIIIISSHIKEDLIELSDKIFNFDNGNVS